MTLQYWRRLRCLLRNCGAVCQTAPQQSHVPMQQIATRRRNKVYLRSSVNLRGLSAGLVLRIAVSVSAMTVTPVGGNSITVKFTVSYRRISIDEFRFAWTTKNPQALIHAGFLDFFGLFWTINWWWGGTLRQTSVTQRLRTAANSCGKVRNPAPTANNPTSSARPGSPAKCIRQDASSIPICGIEPASASTHPTFDQAVTNRSRNARRPWS